MYRYAITANRLVAWDCGTATIQVPTFYVEAYSMGEAAAKADDILGEYHAPSLCVVEV